MRQIADAIEANCPSVAEELRSLAGELKRRPSNVRSPQTSTHITPRLIFEIQQFADANPYLSHQAIAKKFNVNQGRVSEALRGKRQ
jgi:hypothetical protein